MVYLLHVANRPPAAINITVVANQPVSIKRRERVNCPITAGLVAISMITIITGPPSCWRKLLGVFLVFGCFWVEGIVNCYLLPSKRSSIDRLLKSVFSWLGSDWCATLQTA